MEHIFLWRKYLSAMAQNVAYGRGFPSHLAPRFTWGLFSPRQADRPADTICVAAISIPNNQ